MLTSDAENRIMSPEPKKSVEKEWNADGVTGMGVELLNLFYFCQYWNLSSGLHTC
jgi:hypothetical protein